MNCPLCIIGESARGEAKPHIDEDEAISLAYVYGIYAGKGPMLAKLCPRHDVDVQQAFEQLAPKAAG